MSTATFFAASLVFLATLASSQLHPPCAEGDQWAHLSALDYGLVTNSASSPPSFQLFSGPGDFCLGGGHNTFDYVVRKSFDEQIDKSNCATMDGMFLALSARVRVELGEDAAKAAAAKAFNQSDLASFLDRSATRAVCATIVQLDSLDLEKFELCGNRTELQWEINQHLTDALHASLAASLDEDVKVMLSLDDVELPRVWVQAIIDGVDRRNSALREACVKCHDDHCRDCPQCAECSRGTDANDDPTCQKWCGANTTVVDYVCGIPDAVLV